MASFDKHSRCARCRDKGQGNDPCVKQLAYEFCDLLSPEQVLQLSTPTYKIRKEKQKSKDVLVDPSSVTVVSHVEQEGADRPSSVNSSMDLSLPTPSFRKELQDLDDKWAVRMARLEALITMGPRPSPQQPAFSPVKVPVPHLPPEGALSQTPFLQSSVPSGQAGPASGPDGTQTTTSTDLNMVSPLENLYPDTDQERVFLQPGPVASAVSSGLRHFPTRDVMLPDQIEEGEVSEPELDDQPDSDAGDRDKVISEDQNYRETVRGVRAFMGWTHKIQDSVQEQLKILQAELGKGKSSAKDQSALDELHYLSSFNQNVSFAMGKSLQHLSDFTFTQMANLTLVRRDSYVEQLKQGVKPDTFSALRNCPLNGYALFPDAVIRKAEDEIAQFESYLPARSGPWGVRRWAQTRSG